MLLSKWYFDCISPHGDVFIGYAAKLGFAFQKRPALPWSASCFWTGGRKIRQGFVAHTVSASQGEISLNLPRYGVSGRWSGLCSDSSCPGLVLADEQGVRINWQILRPRSGALVNSHDSSIAGSGYVERLDLKLKSGRLPFTRLHWGRFFSDADTSWCVWTAWRGGQQDKSWIFSSAAAAGSPVLHDMLEITEERLDFAGGLLELHQAQSLNDNGMGTHLPPGLRWILPRLAGSSLLQGRERKFLSRGRWHKPDGSAHTGWALHETVTWPDFAPARGKS